MPRIRFVEVGRQKQTWTATIAKPVCDTNIIRAIRARRHALASREIYLDWNDEGTGGNILVGFGRIVGAFKTLDGPTERFQ